MKYLILFFILFFSFQQKVWSEGIINELLIAKPHMKDTRFKETVIVMIYDNQRGAAGLVVNKPLETISINTLFIGSKVTPPKDMINKEIKLINLIRVFIIVFLIISPYVVRNYIHFNQIFIAKSLGYNLWKGNNQLSPPGGYGDLSKSEFNKLNDQLDNLEKNKFYEINRDKIFLYEAINNLHENSFYYFKLFSKKLFSYYFIDLNSNYPNYYNLFHVLPICLISILSFPGLFTFFQKNKFEGKCLGLYFFLNLLIFSVFFILPRYKLIILQIQIILAAHFFTYIMKRYGNK